MAKTIVGLFGTMAEANKVKQALLSDGYDSEKVKVLSADEDGGSGSKILLGRSPGRSHGL